MQKVGGSEIKYIRIFQNSKALMISVGNSYSEDQLMYTFLYNIHKWGRYSTQIDSYQAYLSRKGKITDQKSLYISEFQIDYLKLENSIIATEREKFAQSRWSHCGGSLPTGFF